MIVSEIYETMAGDLYGVVLNEDIEIIRIVELHDRELTPDFFDRARKGFPNSPLYEPCDRRQTWGIIEASCHLVATITNCKGFIVHDTSDFTYRSKAMFGKKARMNYERKYSA